MQTMTLQQLLGIKHPIIQAPMAGVQGSQLAVAVSNAGGLGSLPCAMLNSEDLRGELTAIRDQTDKPYNVNFFCHTPPKTNAKREATWRATLAHYYQEYGIDMATISDGTARVPFSWEAVELLEEFSPPVVSFHFGLPSNELLEHIRGWDSKIISSATTVDEARWLEAQGVDAIIAQGLEAGGHRAMFLSDDLTTQVGTFSLVPRIVQAVKVPVIAAGGIADGQGIAAALSLGAAGVQIGTAYLLCSEANTSAVHRSALKSEAAGHTAITNIFSGRPARSIVNRVIKEQGPISLDTPEFPMAATAIAPLRAAAESRCSGDFSPLWSGQNSTGCKEISAAQLTLELATGSIAKEVTL